MARIAHAVATSSGGYGLKIRTARHELTADEPPSNGGTDTGPAPYALLLSSLQEALANYSSSSVSTATLTSAFWPG